MITDDFDRPIIAKMEVALERACLLLPTGSDEHDARRLVASKIIECAKRGNTSLTDLTEAGCAAASQVAASAAGKKSASPLHVGEGF
jgi:hydroxyethylthiazole kinase-like sugar kinase family protein